MRCNLFNEVIVLIKKTTITDQQLIALIIGGDTNAYAQLVNRYKDLVFTLSLRMLKNREEAEEIAQDAFMKVYKSINKFKGDSKFSTWVYRVTYNTCLDRLKKNKKYFNDVPIDEYSVQKLEIIDNALESMIKVEKSVIIKKCVNELPSEDAYLITLFYFEELTLDEISDIIDVSSNTIKVKLFRARKKLTIILERYFKHEKVSDYET